MSDKVWDYLIVGAGIIGSATAYHLKNKKPNSKVLMIDKFNSSGQGNSIKSNACYRNVFDTDVNVMICTSSTNYYKHVEMKEGIELGLKEIGYLWLLTKNQYEKRLEKTISFEENGVITKISLLEFMDRHQIEYEILNKSQIEKKLPFLQLEFDLVEDEYTVQGLPIESALLGKQCGNLAPDLLVKMYEEKFKKLGGECLYSSEVREILVKEKGKEYDEDYIHTVWRETEIAGVKVKNIESGETSIIKSKNVILATGAWINQLLEPIGINTGIKPKKRQLFTICNVDGLVYNNNFDERYNTIPFLILPTAGVFIKPLPAAKCVEVGVSDDIMRRFETRDPQPSDTSFDNHLLDNPIGEEDFYNFNILPVLQTYFPKVFNENFRITKPSAGMYAYSLDKQPILEREEKFGNLYFVSGTSGSGIMKADAIARLATALICDEEYAELYGNIKMKVSDFSLHKRNLPRESLVL